MLTTVVPDIDFRQICEVIMNQIFSLDHENLSMGLCKKDKTPLLTHWSFVFLALTHQYAVVSIDSGNGLMPVWKQAIA